MLSGLLSVVASMYGRSAGGVSKVSTTQTDDTASATTPATSSRPIRRRRVKIRYPMAKTGSTSHACTIFTWNARPIHTAHGHNGLSSNTLFCHAPAAHTRSSVSSVSAICALASAAAIGVNAITSAASNPAAGPAQRWTTLYSTNIVSTAAATDGSATDQSWKPNALTDNAWSQQAPGILSMLIDPCGSKPPNTNA